MKDFFGVNYKGEGFKLFSNYHIFAIFIIFFICFLIFILKDKLREKKINFCFRYIMGVMLIIEQLFLYIWYHVNNLWSFSVSLPLNLCEASVILCIFLLFTKSYFLYEILYFWAMCGVIWAIITPDLNGYNPSHFIFYHFFITHGLVIIGILFMTFVNRYKPKTKSILKVFIITNIYMVFVGIINIITGGNYLFICKKPKSISLMDYLGPWPFYIISLEVVAIVGFILAYLPFRRKKN
ncbi:YwaF family protein [Defluviitalea phaphyphila]|uniref:YwaF family protein n=1 Tax=Defluviitalea phaphyphila TaxID=1473580 RepID=UPI0007300E7B|nr:TIGR02206 family membrane protein [Defluviitalea phaphyphila]